nr:hypothetical protein [Tanacetum cinerariifolium]
MLCRPKPHSNELNRVAIGYKNPLCLTHAKQVQLALYNGYEIIKDNHAPTILHNTEDTLKIAEITRKKMNAKMNDPECVSRKVKIASHDYSNENFLATFTPQKQLTPEQIFWSNDLKKIKSEALKEQTKFKYQNLTDSIGNNAPTPDKDTPDFESVFVIGKMQASLQGKDNVIRQLKKQISQLQVTHSDTHRTLKVRTTDSQITKLTNQVTNLQAQNDLFRAKNNKIKQHYKELCDSIKITRAKHIEQVTKFTTNNVNLKTSISKDQVKPQVLAREKHAIDVEPIVPRIRNNRDAHLDYLRHLKESVETICHIVKEAKVVRPLDRSIVSACRYTKHSQELLEYVVHIVLWYLDSGCSKHMTKDRSRLMNFIKKFIGTVRFGNDHFGAIMGYGDYVIDGVELIKGSRGSNLYTISTEYMMKSSPICLLSKALKNKSWLWHRCLNHLNFGTINDLARKDLVRDLPRLKFEKDHLCSACQQGKSKKHTHKPKAENTNVEVQNTLHMDLCGPMRVQTINGKKYILVIVDDYSRFTWVKFLRSKDETPDIGSSCSSGKPSSTTIDKDAPSPSILPSSSALQSHSLHQGVAAEPTYMEDHTIAPVDNTPFVNVFTLEPHSKASSSGDLSSTESLYVSQTLHHLNK